MNCASIAQAVAAVVVALIAIFTFCYAASEYDNYKKTEKRPYVTLFRVDIESNLIKKYPIWSHDESKIMPSSEVLSKESGLIQKKVQEIIVDLNFKNTGPVAAKNVQLDWYIFLGDQYTKDGEPNSQSKINETTDFREIFKTIEPWKKEDKFFKALAPGQEMIYYFMFKPEQWSKDYNVMNDANRDDSKYGTNECYIICIIKYNSINNAPHEYFGVYRLHHIRAWTKVYYAILMQSEII
ncbi:MAG: hypothetical protein ABFD66_13850 [Smithella sp.]